MRLLFDRGTLILVDPPPGPVDDLPGVVWDPRVGVWRAPAYRLRDLRRALEARGIAAGPRGTPRSLPGLRAVPLRDYQEAALESWEEAGRRGLVVLPTGAGKTQVALAAVGRVRLPALVLVPTRALLAQWRAAVERVLGAPAGQLGDGRRQIEDVTVATYESAWRRMDGLGARFALLVVDEAHHFGGGQRDEALEMCAAPYRLGLTATPPGDEGAAARLGALVGPVVYRLAVDDLAGSWLAGYQEVTVSVELSAEERAVYERELGFFRSVFATVSMTAGPGRDGWRELLWRARSDETARRGLAAWRRARAVLAYPGDKERALGRLLEKHRGQRVLVFTQDNATAYAVARRFLITPITCEIGRAERAEALARFGRGDLGALVSSRVLDEGIDVPAADVGIVVGGGSGERQHVQRVGRLLRPCGDKRATVYQLVVRATGEVRQAWRRRRALAAG